MELRQYIETMAKTMIPLIDHIQLVEYKEKELDFVYGMEQYHTSFRRMIKQIIRIIWR
jgi:hypothetical protein